MAQEATDRRADVQLLPALPTVVMFRCHSASYLPPTFWLRAWSVECWLTSPQLCADVGGSMLLTDCVSPACMSAAHCTKQCQKPWPEKSLSINADAITSLLTSRVSKKKTPLVKQHYNYLKPVEVTWIIHPTYFLALPSVQCDCRLQLGTAVAGLAPGWGTHVATSGPHSSPASR